SATFPSTGLDNRVKNGLASLSSGYSVGSIVCLAWWGFVAQSLVIGFVDLYNWLCFLAVIQVVEQLVRYWKSLVSLQ
ncbi:hypothetical protein DSO57_1026709, partial [Entomophthora muscae]